MYSGARGSRTKEYKRGYRWGFIGDSHGPHKRTLQCACPRSEVEWSVDKEAEGRDTNHVLQVSFKGFCWFCHEISQCLKPINQSWSQQALPGQPNDSSLPSEGRWLEGVSLCPLLKAQVHTGLQERLTPGHESVSFLFPRRENNRMHLLWSIQYTGLHQICAVLLGSTWDYSHLPMMTSMPREVK